MESILLALANHRHSGSRSRIYIYLTSIICLSTPYKRQFYVISLFKHSLFKFGLQLKLFQVSLSSPKHSHCFKNSNKTLCWQTHICRKQQVTGQASYERFERVTNPKYTLNTEPFLFPSSAPCTWLLFVKNHKLRWAWKSPRSQRWPASMSQVLPFLVVTLYPAHIPAPSLPGWFWTCNNSSPKCCD